MSQLDKIRIFIQDDKGNYYRICNVSNSLDSRGESYVKLMFPDIKGIPLSAGLHNKGNVTPTTGHPNGIHEFTYHYRSGISHFKDGIDKVDQKRNIPTLLNNAALHLLRFTIRTLDIFEVQDVSKVGSKDFVLPNPFDGNARALEFAVSRISGPWTVINDQGKEPVNTYKIPLTDPNVSFHIADAIWHRPPMGKGEASLRYIPMIILSKFSLLNLLSSLTF